MLIKRKTLTLTLILALLVSITVEMQLVNMVTANFTPLPEFLSNLLLALIIIALSAEALIFKKKLLKSQN